MIEKPHLSYDYEEESDDPKTITTKGLCKEFCFKNLRLLWKWVGLTRIFFF